MLISLRKWKGANRHAKSNKVSDEQKLLAEEIRKDFDGQHVINAKQVGKVVGMKVITRLPRGCCR